MGCRPGLRTDRPPRVDPKDLPEQAVLALGEDARRVQDAAVAVPDGGVEIAVGAELEHAAVVVLPRLDDGEQHPLGVHVGEVRVGGMSAEFGDVDVTVAGRRVVEGVEEPARRVVGREGDRQEPGLARDLDLLAQVEERRGEDLAVADDPHGSGLLDDEESMRCPRAAR